MFQDPERQFFALNVEDEIAFALEWKGLNESEIIQRVNDVIEMFSLREIRNQAIDSLSEGQKQKVGLATVVAMQVKNIILDEPTANLDPESTEELAKILQRLKNEKYCIMVVESSPLLLKRLCRQGIYPRAGQCHLKRVALMLSQMKLLKSMD